MDVQEQKSERKVPPISPYRKKSPKKSPAKASEVVLVATPKMNKSVKWVEDEKPSSVEAKIEANKEDGTEVTTPLRINPEAAMVSPREGLISEEQEGRDFSSRVELFSPLPTSPTNANITTLDEAVR